MVSNGYAGTKELSKYREYLLSDNEVFVCIIGHVETAVLRALLFTTLVTRTQHQSAWLQTEIP